MTKKTTKAAEQSQRPARRSEAATRPKEPQPVAVTVSVETGRYDLLLAGIGLLVLVLASSSLLLLGARMARWEPNA